MRVLKRRYLLLGIDLVWVAVSPFAALFIRDNFAPREEALTAAVIYAAVGLGIAAVIFPVAGLNRTLWRYTSLPELVRLVAAVTVTLLLALFTTFAHTRLEAISRSLPVIQWFFLIATMTATRLTIRIWRERSAPPQQPAQERGPQAQHVLIVGVDRTTEFYLRAAAEFAPQRISVVGLLAEGTELHGRLLRTHRVLGVPEKLLAVVRELEVHGTLLDRVVVTKHLDQHSPKAQEALLMLEKSSGVKIDFLPELLGFGSSSNGVALSREARDQVQITNLSNVGISSGRFGGRHIKRGLDLVAAAALIVIFTPLLALIAITTAVDVGRPIVFWQNRPGRYGLPFRLYKFRTMRAAHDDEGNRVPDQDRASKFGALMRRSRLDELPQLYNILVGEMSFVGPRPLLANDHEAGTHERLLLRPGLTGWAQVNGGRLLSPEDKAILDIWYVQNVSLTLDLKIGLRTVALLIRGERVRPEAIVAARDSLVHLEAAPRSADLVSDAPPAFANRSAIAGVEAA